MVFLVFQKLSCLPYVFAISVLACAKSAHVFQKLSHFADFVSPHYNNSSSDSKAFLHFIAFSGSPTVVWVRLVRLVHRAFLFFDVKVWPQSQTDLFMCTTVYTVGIPFCISRKRQSQVRREKPQYRVLQVTWSHITITYVLWRGIRKHCM